MAQDGADPFQRNEDGTAKDPKAFQDAIRSDPVRLEEASKDPETAKVLLGEDMNAFQELLRAYWHVSQGQERTKHPPRLLSTFPCVPSAQVREHSLCGSFFFLNGIDSFFFT
mmetsp:Transcript_15612/g.39803  ORF Transcript_15612/g.39803 Transcript_15612/m.39803 type:complete len:112 (-) Transcript_15612:409-744(-)